MSSSNRPSPISPSVLITSAAVLWAGGTLVSRLLDLVLGPPRSITVGVEVYAPEAEGEQMDIVYFVSGPEGLAAPVRQALEREAAPDWDFNGIVNVYHLAFTAIRRTGMRTAAFSASPGCCSRERADGTQQTGILIVITALG